MSKITIFPSVRETSSGHFITIETALQRIKTNPKQHDLIQRIRNTTDKAQRDELKRTLPAYCFSGMFTRKNTASIQQHSGLICLDFDNETRDNIRDVNGNPIDIELIKVQLNEDFKKDKIRKAIDQIELMAEIYGTGIGEIIVKTEKEFIPATQPIPNMQGQAAIGVMERDRIAVARLFTRHARIYQMLWLT